MSSLNCLQSKTRPKTNHGINAGKIQAISGIIETNTTATREAQPQRVTESLSMGKTFVSEVEKFDSQDTRDRSCDTEQRKEAAAMVENIVKDGGIRGQDDEDHQRAHTRRQRATRVAR